uniref:Internal scaffolding protein n=1 Tax=Dulem virus 154 TaxID=3145631 RepID=A0AAU8B3Z4_9VIRU
MILFQNQFQARDRVITNPGNPIKTLYQAQVDKDGVIDLVENGTENLYDYIQSFKDSTDINMIVKRFANGDVDVLSKTQGAYIDIADMPTTYAEMLNTVIRGEEMFNELPLETRAKFHHSFHEWMASMDDMPSWIDKMGYAQDVKSEAEPAAGDVAGVESSAKESAE